MENCSFKLIFNNKKYDIKLQYNGKEQISNHILIDWDYKHEYSVQSNVSEEVFQQIIDYLNNNQEPDINNANIVDHIVLKSEFNLFATLIKNKINKENILDIYNDKRITDKEEIENKIAENLDFHIKNDQEKMCNINVQSLCNIFGNPGKKLENHEDAYQFIKKVSEKEPEYFILLNYINGAKLSQDSQIECTEKQIERFGYCPEMDWIKILKQEQENYKKIIEKQRKYIDEIFRRQIDEIGEFKSMLVNEKLKQDELESAIHTQNKEIEQQKAKQQELEQVNKDLKDKIAQLMKKQEDLEQADATQNKEIEQQKAKQQELEQVNKDLKDKIAQLMKKQEDLEKVNSKQIGEIKQLMKKQEDLEQANATKIDEKDNESCCFVCLKEIPSKFDQREKSIRIEPGKTIKLPIFLMMPSQNSICTLESNAKGSKIIFKKSGRYMVFYRLAIKKILNKDTNGIITISETNNASSEGQGVMAFHLYSRHFVQLTNDWTFISGFKLAQYNKNEFTYITITSSVPIELCGESTNHTAFEIFRVGKFGGNGVFNGYSQKDET